MANCSYCNSFILFGGDSDNTGRYCNDSCQHAGHLLFASQGIPQHVLAGLVDQVHKGECPRCHGRGPVDVHKAHQVWSAVVLTSWKSSPELSCKRCAMKRQIGATCFSAVLGWWGLPWGLFMTPLQITRNFIEMFGGPPYAKPSPLLEKVVRMQAAAHAIAARDSSSRSGPPPIPNSPSPAENDSRYKPR